MVRAGILPTFQPIRHEACHCALLRAFLVIAMLALGACGSGGDDQGAGPPVASGPGQEITAAGGTVETADHAVKLNIPAGALDAPTAIVVNRLDPGAPPAGLPSTVLNLGGMTALDLYQFGPDGLDFAQPARLTIAYDPAKLPAGTAPQSLVIAKLREDGLIQLARNLQVDAVNHTVSGDITGFSTYLLAAGLPPPKNCGYADETLNEDLQVETINQTTVSGVSKTELVLSFTTTHPDPGCTNDPMWWFELQIAKASVPISGGASREPLDHDYGPWDSFFASDASHRTVSGRFVTNAKPVTAGESYRLRVFGHSYMGHVWVPTSSIRVDVPAAGTSSSLPPTPEHFAAAWDDPYAIEFFYAAAAYVKTPRVRLNWTPVPEADSLLILRRQANELLYSKIGDVVGGVTTYDSDVTADGHYFYRVVAVNGAGQSTFAEQEVLPLGTSAVTDPAFHLCFPTNSSIQPFDCSRPHAPFAATLGASTTIHFKVVMIPLLSQLTSVVNVPDCDIHFSLFNTSSGVVPAAFAPGPLQHHSQNGLQSYDVDLTLDIAATASLGMHGLTLYATGCAGTVAKQPLLIDVRPAGRRLVAVAPRGAGSITSAPAALGWPGDIDCPAVGCLGYFQFGDRLGLSATTTATNLHFDHWEGDCTGNASPFPLLVDGDKFCIAVFAANAATAHAGRIGATQYDSYALDGSQRVHAWGLDSSEQLGNGPGNTPSPSPQPVSGIGDAIAISRSYGGGIPLAIRASGEVWGWGINNSGQLGDGTNVTQALPVAMKDSTGTPVANAVMAAGGGNHALVLAADGTVWATGANPGDGSLTYRMYAAPVPGLTGIVSVAAGAGNSYAVRNDGTVWAWGDNTDGALGDGTTDFRSTPVQVVGLSNIVDVVAGYEFAIALDGNGDVWSWGRNASGQLGDGTTVGQLLPTRVASLSGVKAIAAGTEHALAIMADDTLRAWGRNTNGRLGLGDQNVRLAPTLVGGLATVAAIAAGDAHSLAVLADGTVWAWGSNAGGQLGLGTTVTQYLTPQQVSGLNLN